jgi:hypothetical protein
MSALHRTFEFKVLIYVESEDGRAPVYVAQCLDYDIVAEGETISDVLNSLRHVLETQIEVSRESGIEPFSDFERAPSQFWARYEEISFQQSVQKRQHILLKDV